MPSIAVLVCSDCGSELQHPLSSGVKVPLVSRCDCGGRRHIARFLRERRMRSKAVPRDRRGIAASA